MLAGVELRCLLAALGAFAGGTNQAIPMNRAVADWLAGHLIDIQQRLQKKATPALAERHLYLSTATKVEWRD